MINILIICLFICVLYVSYNLSVKLDRLEDDLVDIEITYTKMQHCLRLLDDVMVEMSDVQFMTLSREAGEE